MLMTSSSLANEVLGNLTDYTFQDYRVIGLYLMDRVREPGEVIRGVPVMGIETDIINEIKTNWVDEIFVYQPENMPYPMAMIDAIMDMGITVHYCMEALNAHSDGMQEVSKVGSYRVITNSLKIVSAKQVIYKRIMDICGGIVGCILTCIIFIFIAPII